MPVTAKKTAAKKTAAKKPAAVSQLVSEFEYVRDTTGTFRLNETGEPEDHISGAIYLKKGPLQGGKPKLIRVTVDILEYQAD